MREPFRRAHTYISILLMLEVLLGLAIILLSVMGQYVLNSFLASAERKVINTQFFNAYTLGFQLLVTYLVSMTMWRRLWYRRVTANVRLLLNVWMFFCFLIVLCGFGNIWTILTGGDMVERTAEASLKKGINMYYTCPEWKLLWDSLQYNKECCGIHSYRDWMNATWMPKEATPAPDDCDMPQLNKKTTVMAPYACCKHNCSSCYQNYIPGSSTGNDSKIADLNIEQINTCGCMPYFSAVLWKVLYWLLALVLIAFKLDLILCGLTKYLLSRQNDLEESYAGSNGGLTDDEGRPLVIVKCPPNVRCVTFDEDESSNCQEGRHCGSCSCCSGGKHQSNEVYTKSRESRILH